jgi:hypothetical protein
VRFDAILPPPGLRGPKTSGQRFRAELERLRIRNADQPRVIALPGIRQVYPHGSPPAGAFVIHGDKETR